MNRQLEKIFLRIGSVWNIITGTITLFYYSSWMQKNVLIDSANNPSGLFAERYFFESVYLFVIGYGLTFILIGAINFYLSIKLKGAVTKKILIWFSIWALASYLTVDIIGFILYFATLITCLLKNRALKVVNS